MSFDLRKLSQLVSPVLMTSLRRWSEKALLPTNMILATPVLAPSLISKMRSTRPFGNSTILGVTRHVVAARALVDLEDALHVRLHERAREGAARLRLNFRGELLVLGLLVAFERNAIDDGIFDHRHQDPTRPGRDPHVLEQAGRIEPLEGGVDLGCVQPLAGSDAEIRANRVRLDTAVTFDIDAQRLRDGNIRSHDRPHDRTEDQHAKQGSCDPNPPQHLHAHSPK